LKKIKKAFRELPESYHKPFFEYASGNSKGKFGSWNMLKAGNPGKNQDYDSNAWGSPKIIIEAARQVFGGTIWLDPASNEQANLRVKAKKYYTKEDDSLTKEWDAKSVFLNYPYGKTTHWTSKAIDEYNAGHAKEMILLCQDDTKTKWWHKTFKACSAICFTNCRLEFYHPETNIESPSPFGSHVFYFGPDPDKFVEVFSQLGTAIRNTWSHHDNAKPDTRPIVVRDVDHLVGKTKRTNGKAVAKINRRTPTHQTHVLGDQLN
jgi:phage N-6-adenine-methyltransferase